MEDVKNQTCAEVRRFLKMHKMLPQKERKELIICFQGVHI